ncbi:glycosyltransferase [Scatolibacter rhodanostii]|uniref:glycosyltransferase n=1 Tax=Scatolibacter rhodanostii TaxID=2014781 RepID=UPI000C08281B|nr:glycosyltransferase family 2 protein [Scatolibacter rhodanostii]
MMTISVCMIVKNEEDVLARCLTCASKFADEIVIVDTGSDDSSKEIAKQFTDKVYDFEWIEDFSAARNYSFSQATQDFCMWLDADDIIEDSEIEKIIALKETLPTDVNVVYMKYNTGFDEKGNVSFSFYRERLIRRSCGMIWRGAVHEAISSIGKRLYTEIAISHRKLKSRDNTRNLRIYESEISKGHPLCARDKFYYARELTYHNRYKEATQVLEEVLDDPTAWIENQIEACRSLYISYLKLNNRKKALYSLLNSFEFDRPRAEICCDLGSYFIEEKKYDTAVFWYETALSCERNDQSGAFILPDCYDFQPHLQLCVCYYRLNNIEKSIYHNEQAGKLKPESQSYLHNKAFFDSLKH